MAARRPQETMLALAAVIGGLWIGLAIVRWQQRSQVSHLPEQLPDFEIVDQSPEEIEAEHSIRFQDHAPRTWDHIHLRAYGEEGGVWHKLMRCTIDADEVVPTNPDQFAVAHQRYRERDELPPAWWPALDAASDSPWALPEWWAPEPGAGVGIYWSGLGPENSKIGHYLHYEPETRLMHLWEWRRSIATVGKPEIPEPTVSHIVPRLTQQLRQRRHPVTADGWLHVIDHSVLDLGVAAELIPSGLATIDALLYARAGEFEAELIAFRGIEEAPAREMLGDLPMRAWPAEADQSPPVEAWSFALPVKDGEAWLPSWWRVGAGPRWAYTVVRPGSGTVEMARWAAYDRAAQTLYVWSWYSRQQPRSPRADILARPPAGS